ncbi:inactive serine/threonine-protein kinase TEX14-like isoform X3 [Balaenoptera ricei]|uniref:inactive serine/threonine-protein kinase TEX14-like isoform X3 n=1 Tax=Balaenoptera ricei TaxID=2746895 RepID=UPI0028BEFE94|nr:inactive serine/threonine-protein kinase TEX14-like isoform X3 [Balaenoptera ricei]
MPSLRSRFPVELGSGIQEARWAVCIAWLWPGAQAGASPGSCGEVDGENSAGQTVLFLAALLGHSSAVQLLLAFGASPNHRCLDGSTPVHAGAFSGCSLLMLHVLQAGGDLRLHDQQGRIPREWAEQGGAKQSWEICCAHTSALVHGSELARTAPLGQLQASSGQSLCGGLRLTHTDRARRPEQIRTPQIPAFGFGQVSGRCWRECGPLRPLPASWSRSPAPAEQLVATGAGNRRTPRGPRGAAASPGRA